MTSNSRPLLDTSVILGALERNEAASLLAITEAETSVASASLTVLGELEHGAQTASGTPNEHPRSRTLRWYLLTHDPPAYETQHLARLFGQVSATASREGIKIGQNDRWIIAECIYQNRALLTCDEIMQSTATACGVPTTLLV